MAKVVNLSRVRKSRARDDKKAQAGANAVKFGRTRVEKLQNTAQKEKQRRILDGHMRDDTGKE
jgi:hypothetical protein